jgi:hypothetical protein
LELKEAANKFQNSSPRWWGKELHKWTKTEWFCECWDKELPEPNWEYVGGAEGDREGVPKRDS